MAENPYIQAAQVLPVHMRKRLLSMDEEIGDRAEEIRLRKGGAVTVLLGGEELPLEGHAVTEEDLRTVLEQASGASAHAVLDQVGAGFVTIKGGHRIGLCGEAVMRDGRIHTLTRLSSLAIRIARPISGLGVQLLPGLMGGGRLCSTLILAPPGAGKTTLLRDLIRTVSDGEAGVSLRVGVADDRGEIAAVWEGTPQLDVGRRTDVISGCPKGQGLQLLLRGMNPQVLAVDEITAEEDVEAITWASGCGVKLLATARGAGMEDLATRPLYRRMLSLNLFQWVLLVERRGECRCWRAEVLI